MNSTAPTYQLTASFTLLSIFFALFLSVEGFCQSQAPSIQSGVTFQWADTQTSDLDPATISSITVGSLVYQSIVAPTGYALQRVGPDGPDRNRIVKNGALVNTNSNNANWNADALASFQDKDLNHYFYSDSNGRNLCNNFLGVTTTDSQLQSLYFTPGIPSNAGGIIAVTERNANNCYYIAIYGTPAGGGVEQFLGDTFVRANTTQWGPQFNAPPAGVDYWNAGRVIENGGTIGIALFLLEDLALVGSVITRVDILGATADHGDGKFFILQRYAVPKSINTCMNETTIDTVNGSTIPSGSTFTLTSGPTVAGQEFVFNSDGTFSYEPPIGHTGDVVFEYEVCLPAPNASTCDTSTVTITYESGPGSGCECNSGGANGPLLQN